MSKTYNVAVVGATGAVGETMLKVLAERQFPIGRLHVLASERSAGSKIEFGARQLVVENLATFDPAGVDHCAVHSGEGGAPRDPGQQPVRPPSVPEAAAIGRLASPIGESGAARLPPVADHRVGEGKHGGHRA